MDKKNKLWKLSPYSKTPTWPNDTDKLSHASTLPRKMGRKIPHLDLSSELTTNCGFWHSQNHTFYFSQGEPALISTSTGLENELPEMMPVCVAYRFTIYTSRYTSSHVSVWCGPAVSSFCCMLQNVALVNMSFKKVIWRIFFFSFWHDRLLIPDSTLTCRILVSSVLYISQMRQSKAVILWIEIKMVILENCVFAKLLCCVSM